MAFPVDVGGIEVQIIQSTVPQRFNSIKVRLSIYIALCSFKGGNTKMHDATLSQSSSPNYMVTITRNPRISMQFVRQSFFLLITPMCIEAFSSSYRNSSFLSGIYRRNIHRPLQSTDKLHTKPHGYIQNES